MPYVLIDKNKISKLDIINTKGITASEVKRIYNPDTFINLALYDMSTKENIVKLIDENIESGYLFSDTGFGITKTNQLIWTTLVNAKVQDNIKDFVAGAPTLVVDGKINICWGNKVSTQIQGKHKRSALGINKNGLVLYVSPDEITLEKLAERMLDVECNYAINLDGGGSCHLQRGKVIYASSVRANPTWLLIYNKKEDVTMAKPRICLDAGHGGKDSGATHNKLYEKDINLEVINLMEWLLRPYVDICSIRTDDTTIELTSRPEIANRAKVDYYFSVHCNSAVNTAAKGWEIYIVGKGGKAEQLANRIRNRVLEAAIPGLADRGIKVKNLCVLRETDAPAVLVENAFISNFDDRKNILTNSSVLQTLAYCYAQAILDILNIKVNLLETVTATSEYEKALDTLVREKIINSKDYWLNNKNSLNYLDLLIINMANYIENNK